MGDLMGMKVRPDSTSTLTKIHRPTLILQGSDDQLIPLSDAVAMRTAIAKAHLRLVPDAGHLLNMEQPEMTNQAIRSFLKDIDS
jgi:pimeloyl-ACP methyl ester carboxylesterase